MNFLKYKGIIHSGGATGADQAFGNYGTQFAYKVIHHSFIGHVVNGSGTVEIHTIKDIAIASESLSRAAHILQKDYPPQSEYEHMLLIRDYFQAQQSEFIIAIASLDNEFMLTGGTAWAVQMAIDMGKTVYAYDDFQTYKWYISKDGSRFTQYNNSVSNTGIFAGIGSRKISTQGLDEIQNILSR